jgi:hypothetical protein
MNMPAFHRIGRMIMGMVIMVMMVMVMMVVVMVMVMTSVVQKSKLLILVGLLAAGTAFAHLDLLIGPLFSAM